MILLLVACFSSCMSFFKPFLASQDFLLCSLIYIANNMDPDQTAPKQSDQGP